MCKEPVNKSVNYIFYILIAILFLFGMLIRAKMYLLKVPLWLDEIMLAQSFIDRNFLGMFMPLEAFQKAPPLFCCLVLLSKKLFGISELSIRLIPFISSILSVFAFFILLKDNVKNKLGVLIGLFLFVICVPLVYFSQELKPYGTDVLVCILLLISYKFIDFSVISVKKILLYTLASLFIALFSFPAMFIIPALIITKCIQDKKIYYGCFFIFIGIALAGLYLYFSDLSNYEFLKVYWGNQEKGFSILPSFSFIGGFIKDCCQFYVYNCNKFLMSILVMPLIVIGSALLYKEKDKYFYLIILIFVFAVFASMLSFYPLKPKLALFLAPIFILLISKCFDLSIFSGNFKIKYSFYVFLCLYLILTFGINIPFINISEDTMVYYNKTSSGRDKSVLDRLKVKEYSLFLLDNFKENDIVLASKEFLYNINWYKAYYKYNKYYDIKTIENVDFDIVDEYTKKFIDENLNKSKLWFFGRDYEYYFRCSGAEVIEEFLKNQKIDYTIYKNNDLYLIFTNNIRK